jgi:hypothetical protein
LAKSWTTLFSLFAVFLHHLNFDLQFPPNHKQLFQGCAKPEWDADCLCRRVGRRPAGSRLFCVSGNHPSAGLILAPMPDGGKHVLGILSTPRGWKVTLFFEIITICLILFSSRQLVHRTEVAENTKSPEWKPFEITVKRLCGAEKERLSFWINYLSLGLDQYQSLDKFSNKMPFSI